MPLTVSPPDTGEAQGECGFEALMDLAVAEVDAVVGLARKETVHIYRAGRFLSEAQKVLPADQTWGKTLASYRISRTTAWEAMELFQRAESEEAVSSMSITEAKVKYGIVKTKKKSEPADQTEPPATLSFPRSASRGDILDQHEDEDEAEELSVDTSEVNDDEDAVGEGDPITEDDVWVEREELPQPKVNSSYKVGDVIYQVDEAGSIYELVIGKITEKSFFTGGGQRIKRDSCLYSDLEQAKAKWRSSIGEQIADLQGQIADLQNELQVGPKIEKAK